MAPIERVRNIGIVAHIDAGKTTLTTRLLFCAGVVPRIAEVDDGGAMTDADWLEQLRHISIRATAVPFDWAGHRVHLVDTPGHVDFTIEVERSLRVLDGAVVVFCAVHGVQPQSETVWRQADKFGIPRLAFVNKMDLPGASFEEVLDQMRRQLGARPAPLQWPLLDADRFTGAIDLVTMRALEFHGDVSRAPSDATIPAPMLERARSAREALIETVADADDGLAALYLGGGQIDEGDLRAAIRRACIARQIVPVLCGAARRNQGHRPALDAIVSYLPSPADLPAVTGVDPDRPDRPLSRRPDHRDPLSALVFKVVVKEQHRNAFLRLFSGTLQRRDTVLNVRTGRRTKVTELCEPHAEKLEDINRAVAGDIVVVKRLREVMTGDTITAPDAPILLERIDTYEPVVSMAIEPRSNADRDRLNEALATITVQDPSFHVREDEQTGQTIISGMGELHLEIITTRLERDHRACFRVSRPQVVLRQTVTDCATGTSVFRRTTAEAMLHGEAACRVEPQARGAGNLFRCGIPTDAEVPSPLIEAAMEGLRDAAQSGTEGDPLEDALVTLISVAAHQDFQPQAAVRAAAAEALRRAVTRAAPVRLEPIMEVELLAPEEHVGSVIGDLNARRGQVRHVGVRGERSLVRALIPLEATFGYATRFRSLTSGRGDFTMHFSAYDVAGG